MNKVLQKNRYGHHIFGRHNIWFLFAAALCGVVMYNYLKVKDVRASQLAPDSLPDRIAKASFCFVSLQQLILTLELCLNVGFSFYYC